MPGTPHPRVAISSQMSAWPQCVSLRGGNASYRWILHILELGSSIDPLGGSVQAFSGWPIATREAPVVKMKAVDQDESAFQQLVRIVLCMGISTINNRVY